MNISFRHSAIVVNDIKSARHFYEDLLGFLFVAEKMEEGDFIESIVGLNKVKVYWVKLKAKNGIILELLHYYSPQSKIENNDGVEYQLANKLGHSHIALTVEDVDSLVEKLKIAGIKIINRPIFNDERTAKLCYVHDTEGNILELVQEIKN